MTPVPPQAQAIAKVKEPSGHTLWLAFFSGNKRTINPYAASPSELTKGLRAVWQAALKSIHDSNT